MNYESFSELAERPTGKTSSAVSGPLYFGEAEELAELVGDFPVMGDFMGDHDMEDFVQDFPAKFPQYALLAIIDHGAVLAAKPEYHFDSYDEWFLAVDTSKTENPVFLWTGEGGFHVVFSSFEAFHASLEDWRPS